MLTATDLLRSQQPQGVSISKNEIHDGQKISFRKKSLFRFTELMGKSKVPGGDYIAGGSQGTGRRQAARPGGFNGSVAESQVRPEMGISLSGQPQGVQVSPTRFCPTLVYTFQTTVRDGRRPGIRTPLTFLASSKDISQYACFGVSTLPGQFLFPVSSKELS
jgi:hypothetical protein